MLLGLAHLVGHLAKLALHAVEPALGGGLQIAGDLVARGPEPGPQAGGQRFQALFQVRGAGAFGRAQAAVQGGEGTLQALDGLGRAGLRLAEPGAHAVQHLVDHLAGGRAAPALRLGDPLPQDRQGLAGAVFAVIEMTRHLAQGLLQGTQGLGRPGPGGFLLHAAQALDQARLLGARLAHRAFEPRRHRHALALRLLDAGHRLAHGMLHPGNGQAGAGLGALDAIGQPVQGQGHAADLVGRMLGRLIARRRGPQGLGPHRRLGRAGGLVIGANRAFDERPRLVVRIVALDPRTLDWAALNLVTFDWATFDLGTFDGVWAIARVGEIGLRGDILRPLVLEDHPVQPFAQGHARTPRQVLGDLTRFRVYPLDAPGRPRHTESSSRTDLMDATYRTLGCKRGVNARCSVSAIRLWTNIDRPTP